MLKRLELFMIAAIFILITAIIVIVYTMQREQEFTDHNNDIQKAVVHGAAYAINLQLRQKHRHVQLFIEEYASLINHLNRYPNDEKTVKDIEKRLRQRFPDFFTFTISDPNGQPVLENIESLVGEACLQDIHHFANTIKMPNNTRENRVVIHPQPFHYHFDIMAPLPWDRSSLRIFFASFHLQEIIETLKNHSIPGQNLMIVKQSQPDLIEVTVAGTRDKLSRNSHLSADERRRIRFYENIPDSDWQVINLPDESYLKSYRHSLWKEAILIIGLVTFALLLLIFILTRYSDKQG